MEAPNRARKRAQLFFLLSTALMQLLSLRVSSQPLGERVGPQFPYLSVDARAAALGDASLALIDHSAGYTSNPSTLGFLARSSVSGSSKRIRNGVSSQHLAGAYRVDPVSGIAASVDILHHGGWRFYGEESVRNRGYEVATKISYGRIVADGLAAGLAVQVLRATTPKAWAVAADVGLCYVPTRYYRFGFSLKGLGSDFRTQAPVLAPDVITARLSKVVGLGVTFDYPFEENGQRLTVVFENDKILGHRGIIYKLGAEYSPFPFVAARLGSRLRGSEFEPHLGFGVGFLGFAADYAYSYSRRDATPSHIVSISAVFD